MLATSKAAVCIRAGNSISAVLDWGSSMARRCLADRPRSTLRQPWVRGVVKPPHSRLRVAALRGGLGVGAPQLDESVRCYELAVGLDNMGYQPWAAHARPRLDSAPGQGSSDPRRAGLALFAMVS